MKISHFFFCIIFIFYSMFSLHIHYAYAELETKDPDEGKGWGLQQKKGETPDSKKVNSVPKPTIDVIFRQSSQSISTDIILIVNIQNSSDKPIYISSVYTTLPKEYKKVNNIHKGNGYLEDTKIENKEYIAIFKKKDNKDLILLPGEGTSFPYYTKGDKQITATSLLEILLLEPKTYNVILKLPMNTSQPQSRV